MNVLFTIIGKVQEGNKRGKRLGFPTINLSLNQEIPDGVYISQTEFSDKIYNSLTFIGIAKTFNETIFQSETYILNFKDNVYGHKITVNLLKKLRDNQKFNSPEELVEQMKKDKQMAEEFFRKNN